MSYTFESTFASETMGPSLMPAWGDGMFDTNGYTTLEATQWQIDGFFSQLPCKCHQNRVASVGD